MKKIFTLIAATFLTVAVFAADRKPVVTVSASKSYEIVIDGRSYFSNNGSMSISSLYNGQHSIQVYQASRGFFFKRKKLVSASSFQLRNNDVDICLDFRGQISITEKKSDFGKWNDRDDKGWGNDHDKKDAQGQYGHDQDSRDKGHDNDRNRHF